ncbi:MAG: tetratricopeptide repeat protein, partial [Acidobacteria bacterium]|nr:tetratricopeptide repeat protein [Acidobacteriota bacterium]
MRRLLLLASFFFLPSILPGADTFLVLPLFNLSSSPGLDWIGESVAEAVSQALTDEGVLVVGREDLREACRRLSLRPYARLTTASVIKIAETLDATRVMYGAFEFHSLVGALDQSKGTLRISTRILNLKQVKAGAETVEMGAIEDLNELQARVAWQALKKAAPRTAATEADFLHHRPTVRLDAMESYVRGLVAGTDEQRIALFTKAANLAPDFTPPCFQLGRVYWKKKEYRTAIEWLSRVKPPDSRFHHATFLLGLCRFHAADYAGAQAAFQTVADAVPLSEVFNNLGAAESRRNLPEAIENFRKALAGDDSDPVYQFNLGYALWRQRDFAAAADHFRAAQARDSSDAVATYMLGHCLQKTAPRTGDPRTTNLERIKENYEERADRPLKAELGSG